MGTEIKMTAEAAERMMEQMKLMFQTVRILKADRLQQKDWEWNASLEENPCECYALWKKGTPCENCIARKAYEGKCQKTKLELVDSVLYEVTARYLEIDGVPCVIELVNQIEEDALLDSEGRRLMMRRLTGFDEKLYKDVLTGVYNRNYYEEQIKTRRELCGIAMIDLDEFKLWNDTYGHNAGDMVLDTVVRAIRSSIRKTDTLIRYGGDEFLLIMPEVDEELFLNRLRTIQKTVNEADLIGYSNRHISISVGGVLTQPGESMEEAVARADELMYRAKKTKNMVVTEEDDSPDCTAAGSKGKRERHPLILIADDSQMNRLILSEMLDDEYEIVEAVDGNECVSMLEVYGERLSLVLLDIVMPNMDGFEVLSVMNQRRWIENIPVIMISSEDSLAIVRKAYEWGVSDYISRPFDAQVVYRRVANTIRLYAKQRHLIAMLMEQMHEKEKNNRMMISILSQIVEFRNGESGLHVLHIGVLTEILLNQLVQKTNQYNLSHTDCFLITTASALHDIGKIGIDEKILNKPGRLNREEFEEMKKHTLIGASMLDSLEMYQDEKLVKVAYKICRWHHERYDGKGYPDGLKGEEIPIAAQVVAMADVYDALVSERVYKKAFSHDRAMEMILGGECGIFNPLLLDCLRESQDEIREKIGKMGRTAYEIGGGYSLNEKTWELEEKK